MPEAPLAWRTIERRFLARRAAEAFALRCLRILRFPRSAASPVLAGEHLVGAIDGARLVAEMLLHVDAEVRDRVLIVSGSRLLVRGTEILGRRVARHAEHGVRIEFFLGGRLGL